MFKFKLSIVLIYAGFCLISCSDSSDEESDPENSCEYSDLRIESLRVEENVATVTATGGQPPYKYVWSDGTEGAVYIGWPGTVEVTVTDQKGCSETREALLQGIYNIVGVWKMVVFNEEVPVGQYIEHYSAQCPEILVSKTSMSGNYEFQSGDFEGLFNYAITDSTIDTNLEYNADCEITKDLPDTETETTETGEGQIYYNDSDLVLDYV